MPTFDEGAAAIITGGGQGIGRGVALALAAQGVDVVINDVNSEAANAVKDEVEALGARGAVSTEPVGSFESGRSIVQTAMDAFGRVDILFNNAGIFRPENFWDISDDDFDMVLDVNFKGVFALMRAAASASMIPNHRGKIINTTSRVAFRGKLKESSYAAAKMAVVGMTISASLDLMAHGINVNAISPAAWTAMAEAQPEEVREAMRKSRAASVLGRVGEVDDVVPVILFLASRESDFLTGQILQATGQPVALL
jgi:3-oxoacyl-[acyl-carrier protein] reductase